MSCSDLRSLFDPRVDLAAKRTKINRLREKRLSAAFQSLGFGLGVALGSAHDDWHVGAYGLCLRKQFKAAHPRHIDVRQDQDDPGVCRFANALKRSRRRLGKVHGEATIAKIAPELLTKQHL